jgi:hypothetical protein
MALQLDAITLRGVGSYVHGARLEVRPLTILSGVNSSGKSTWFKALDMLRRSAEKDFLPFAFDVDDSSAYNVGFMNYSLYCSSDLTDFADGDEEARFGPPASVGLEFSVTQDLSFDGTNVAEAKHQHAVERFLRCGLCPKGTKLQVKLAHPTSNTDSHILKAIPGMYHLVELLINGTAFSFQKAHNPDCEKNADPRDYKQFRTSVQTVAISEDELRQLVATRIQQIMREFFKGYFHISAVRSLPSGFNVTDSNSLHDAPANRSVETDGSKSFEVFYWNTVKRKPYHPENFPGMVQVEGLEERISDALKRLLKMTFESDAFLDEGDLARFANEYVIGPQYPKQFSSGFHQLFPIIVQLGVMHHGELLSIENPEVHLHPDLQLSVSEYLLQQSRAGRRIMIETHSDLIIRRVVRAIIAEEDGMSQQHVSLNFSSPQKDSDNQMGSSLRQFGVDAAGRIEWPEGFMDASINESQRMMHVMYGRRRAASEEEEE